MKDHNYVNDVESILRLLAAVELHEMRDHKIFFKKEAEEREKENLDMEGITMRISFL